MSNRKNLSSLFFTLGFVFLLCSFTLWMNEKIAGLPVAENPTPTIPLIEDRPIPKVAASEIQCLALNIYYESKNEPELGQWAVARVTKERLDAGFADTICDVVYQGAVYRDRLKVAMNRYGSCQFSWACINTTPKIPDTTKYLRA